VNAEANCAGPRDQTIWRIVEETWLAERPDLSAPGLYGLIVGGRDITGVGRAVAAVLRREPAVLRHFASSIQATLPRCMRAKTAPARIFQQLQVGRDDCQSRCLLSGDGR
jgi:hypothetical protein